jgi:hypothetical protein
MATKRKKRASRRTSIEKDVCFVIMPFGGWLDDYYLDIYSPAIKGAGLEPHRADDLFRPSTIVHDIWAYTKKARLILADLSGKNPNVFYELGLAHALAKPAILIAESMDDVPFDLRALRVLVYDKNAPEWGRILKEKVQASIREVLKAPAEAVLPAFLETKGSGPKTTVTAHEKELLDLRQQIELIREEVAASDHRHRVGKGIDLGPTETREIIRKYMADGMPESIIVRRIQPLGPPRGWIVDTIRELKTEIRKRGSRSE